MKARNIKLFFVHEALFQFSDVMLIIVLPLFLYDLFGSLSMIFLFNFIWNLIYSILFIPIFNAGMRWNKPKLIMMLGIIFYIASLALFSQTTTANSWLIIPGLIAFSLYISFYWVTRHWFFSVNTDYEQVGKQVSYLGVIRVLISFIAPIIGGFVSFIFSFNAAFLLGVVAGIISLIPIALFHAPAHGVQYSWKEVRRILKKPELKNIRLAYIGEGLASYFITWPWILAFGIFIGTIKDLGILIGVTTLVAAIVTRLAGHWFDQRKRTTVLKRLTYTRSFVSLLYASLFFFPYTTWVWIVDLSNRLVGQMHQTVVDSYLFAFSNKIHPVYFHFNREVHLNIARMIANGVLMIVFLFLPAEFLWVSIGIGSFALLGWLNLRRSDYLLH